MQKRGYQLDPLGLVMKCGGNAGPPYHELPAEEIEHPIYPEHDAAYLQECLENLKEKGIDIV